MFLEIIIRIIYTYFVKSPDFENNKQNTLFVKYFTPFLKNHLIDFPNNYQKPLFVEYFTSFFQNQVFLEIFIHNNLYLFYKISRIWKYSTERIICKIFASFFKNQLIDFANNFHNLLFVEKQKNFEIIFK